MATEPRYEIIIYWSDEDGAFIAEVPELPGCAADGVTYEAAVNNVKTVIAEWIEMAQKWAVRCRTTRPSDVRVTRHTAIAVASPFVASVTSPGGRIPAGRTRAATGTAASNTINAVRRRDMGCG
jgi:predicted RNase H-like HicB family nuclease